jgi:hypothetical protein
VFVQPAVAGEPLVAGLLVVCGAVNVALWVLQLVWSLPQPPAPPE